MENSLNQTTTGFDSPRKYIGQYQDATNLSYLHARYYDGASGKFLSQDPLVNALGTANTIYGRSMISVLANPQELNTYAYAQNNPITKSDPSGLWGWDTVKGVGVGWVGGAIQFASNPIGSTYEAGWGLAAASHEIYRTNGGAISQGWNELNDSSSDYEQGLVVSPVVAVAGGSLVGALRGGSIGVTTHTIPKSRMGHIFRNAENHVPYSSANLQLLLDTANNSANRLGRAEKTGHIWYGATQKNGTQVWVETRNGNIWNAGVNVEARTFNPQTGLSSPAKQTNQ